MGANEFVALAAGVVTVLGGFGGVLRYVVRMAASTETLAVQTKAMGEAFGRHVQSSDELHKALTDRVTLHGEQLAALNARAERRR